jgi:hypothetical protein
MEMSESFCMRVDKSGYLYALCQRRRYLKRFLMPTSFANTMISLEPFIQATPQASDVPPRLVLPSDIVAFSVSDAWGNAIEHKFICSADNPDIPLSDCYQGPSSRQFWHKPGVSLAGDGVPLYTRSVLGFYAAHADPFSVGQSS